MKAILTPAYKDFFGSKNKPCPKKLIEGIPTSIILQMTCFLSGIIHLHPFNLKKTEFFFLHWLGAFPEEEEKRLNNIYFNLQKENPNFQVSVFTQERILHFINFCLKHNNTLERKLNSENSIVKHEEVKILKAFLIVAEESEGDASKPIKDSKSYEGFEKYYISTWPVFINQNAFESRNSFVTQSIQALMFFSFAEKSEDFSPYIHEYYEDIGVENGEKYIYHLLDIYMNLLKENKPGLSIKVSPEEKGIYDLLVNLSINIPNVKNNHDFEKEDYTSIRKKPVFRLYENEFIVLNYNFFLDKIFRGVKFDFFTRAHKNNYLETFNDKYKSFGDFKAAYSFHFSEKIMFYNVINRCFQKHRNIIKINGEKSASEYSDYYIRDGKNIFLFEFKDIAIPSKIKFSNDGPAIKKEIDKQLIKNGKKRKGISQLVEVIKTLDNSGPFEFDNFIKKKVKQKNITVYPILVLTDEMFGFPGVNKYLGNKFSEISKEKEIEINVKNLTLIDLDTLIDMHYLIKSKQVNLKKVIDAYHKNSKNKIKKLPKHPSIYEYGTALRGFKEYLNEFLRKHKIQTIKKTDLFGEVLESVFVE